MLVSSVLFFLKEKYFKAAWNPWSVSIHLKHLWSDSSPVFWDHLCNWQVFIFKFLIHHVWRNSGMHNVYALVRQISEAWNGFNYVANFLFKHKFRLHTNYFYFRKCLDEIVFKYETWNMSAKSFYLGAIFPFRQLFKEKNCLLTQAMG